MASRRELLDFFNLPGPPFCKESPVDRLHLRGARSGAGVACYCTTMLTAGEQLLSVSSSPSTASTHAP